MQAVNQESSIHLSRPVMLIHCEALNACAMIERLNKLFHDEKEAYTKFLACRGPSAQWLLDVLQDVSLEIGHTRGGLIE
jgi:hypothetical protein